MKKTLIKVFFMLIFGFLRGLLSGTFFFIYFYRILPTRLCFSF